MAWGGPHVRGGFPLPSPVLTRGREWAWFGLGPGVSPGPHFPSQGLAGSSAPLGTLVQPRLRQWVFLSRPWFNPLFPAPSHAGLGAEEGREGPPHPTSALNSTACPRSSHACALWSRELAAPARAPHGEGPRRPLPPPGPLSSPKGRKLSSVSTLEIQFSGDPFKLNLSFCARPERWLWEWAPARGRGTRFQAGSDGRAGGGPEACGSGQGEGGGWMTMSVLMFAGRGGRGGRVERDGRG